MVFKAPKGYKRPELRIQRTSNQGYTVQSPCRLVYHPRTPYSLGPQRRTQTVRISRGNHSSARRLHQLPIPTFPRLLRQHRPCHPIQLRQSSVSLARIPTLLRILPGLVRALSFLRLGCHRHLQPHRLSADQDPSVGPSLPGLRQQLKPCQLLPECRLPVA